MARTKKKSEKRMAVKDLKPRDARNVKGGISVTKTTDVSSTKIWNDAVGTTTK